MCRDTLIYPTPVARTVGGPEPRTYTAAKSSESDRTSGSTWPDLLVVVRAKRPDRPIKSFAH